jgi:predicted anti-sigma-YlaC factor YlaD
VTPTGASPPAVLHAGTSLSAMLDGELGGGEESVIQDHLRICAQCRDELDAVRLARSWVRALPPAEPPFGFLERRTVTTHRQPRRRAVVATIGAVAAVVATVVGITPQREAVGPANPNLVNATANPLAAEVTTATLVSRTSRTTVAIDPLAPVGAP